MLRMLEAPTVDYATNLIMKETFRPPQNLTAQLSPFFAVPFLLPAFLCVLTSFNPKIQYRKVDDGRKEGGIEGGGGGRSEIHTLL